jgi:hypothetical protein
MGQGSSMNYHKKLFLISILLLSFFCRASCFKDIWVNIKYGNLTPTEQLFYWNELLEQATPLTKQDRLWLLVTKTSRLSMESKKEASSQLKVVVKAFEQELLELKDPLDYMCAGLLSLLYAKAPAWPVSIGSPIKAQSWMKKAETMAEDPNVAFYLAFTAHHLKMHNKAQEYIFKVNDGFRAECSLLAQGRLRDISVLQGMLDHDLNLARQHTS